MAESQAEPTPGPNRSKSERAVLDVLKTTTNRAMTVGMVEEEVDYSRRTVHTRLNELAEEDPNVRCQEIGNATGYWFVSEKANAGLTGLVKPFERAFGFYRGFLVAKLLNQDQEDVLRWQFESDYAGYLPLFVVLSIVAVASTAVFGLMTGLSLTLAVSLLWLAVVLATNRISA